MKMTYASFKLTPEGFNLENNVSGLYVSDLAIPCAVPIAKKYDAKQRYNLHLSLIHHLSQLLINCRDVDMVKTQARMVSILEQIAASKSEIEWKDGWSKTYISSDGAIKLTYSIVGVTIYGEPLKK